MALAAEAELTQKDNDYPTWRDLERVENSLASLAKEVRDNKSMSRDDLLDRLRLMQEQYRDALNAARTEAKERSDLDRADLRARDDVQTQALTSVRGLVERVIFAVIGALAAGSLALLIEIIRVLSPRAGPGS